MNNDSWRGAFVVLVRTRGRGASAPSGEGWLRTAPLDFDISGGVAVWWLSMVVRAVQQGRAADVSSRRGQPTTCSTRSASNDSLISIQPETRTDAARCGAAPKPRRSSDEAPPWQRGPSGRRDDKADENGRREADMGDFRRQRDSGIAYISLQSLRARSTGATTVPCGAS